MVERNLAFDEVRNIITTKKANEWEDIVKEVKSLFGKDISHTVPVFLTPDDFSNNSPIFDANLIFYAWFRFDKMPVLLINSQEELEDVLGPSLAYEFLRTAHFIK